MSVAGNIRVLEPEEEEEEEEGEEKELLYWMSRSAPSLDFTPGYRKRHQGGRVRPKPATERLRRLCLLGQTDRPDKTD